MGREEREGRNERETGVVRREKGGRITDKGEERRGNGEHEGRQERETKGGRLETV